MSEIRTNRTHSGPGGGGGELGEYLVYTRVPCFESEMTDMLDGRRDRERQRESEQGGSYLACAGVESRFSLNSCVSAGMSDHKYPTPAEHSNGPEPTTTKCNSRHAKAYKYIEPETCSVPKEGVDSEVHPNCLVQVTLGRAIRAFEPPNTV